MRSMSSAWARCTLTAKGELTKYQRSVLHEAYIMGVLDTVTKSTLDSLIKRGLIAPRNDDWVLTEEGKRVGKSYHEYKLRQAGANR